MKRTDGGQEEVDIGGSRVQQQDKNLGRDQDDAGYRQRQGYVSAILAGTVGCCHGSVIACLIEPIETLQGPNDQIPQRNIPAEDEIGNGQGDDELANGVDAKQSHTIIAPRMAT